VPRRTEPDPHALAIGQRIKLLREEAGLTLEKLAYEADFSKGHLSNLERGYVMPTVATLQVLADRLGVLVADMVSDPDGSDRERILELTRKLPAGTLKKLVRELSPSKTKRTR
jgi:transcriptional regulator with XRE-family HTH domain